MVTAFALATAFAPWQMVPAAAASCMYDGVSRVDVTLAGNASDTLDVSAGAIRLDTVQCGTATVANTDTIVVTAGAGTNALMIVDPASFQPGLTPEGTGLPEIEISVNFAAGTDSLTLQGTPGGDTFTVGSGGINVNGDDDDGDVSFTSASLTMDGMDGDDRLTGGAGNEVLMGGPGDDTLAGGDGNDDLQGGAGNNAADFSTIPGPVKVLLGKGQATGQGTDTLASIQGVIGTAQNDRIAGGGAAENLDGRDGNDTITGGLGDDILAGGQGVDTVSYAGAGNRIVATIGGTATGQGTDTLGGFEKLIGSKQKDRLTGNSGANVLDGRGGSDRLIGQAGDDSLIGGTGNDHYDGGLGADSAHFSASRNPVILSLLAGTATGEGADTLTRIEVAIGSPKGDSLRGGNGNDTLRGGRGKDKLTGLRGNDVLIGGPGTDTVNYGAASGVSVDLRKGTASGEGNDSLSGVENVQGNAHRDIMIGSNVANVFAGNNGNDVLRGGGGNDRLSGVSGSDRLSGGPGKDTLRGGKDNDSLDGGPGTDTCYQDEGRGPRRSCERPRRRARSRAASPTGLAAARLRGLV